MLSRQDVEKVLNQSLSPLANFFADASVSEIMVNPGGHVFIESAGEMLHVSASKLSSNDIEKAITALGKLVNQLPTASDGRCAISASVDNMRIAGTLAPASHGGPSLCIRKHKDPSTRPDLEGLVANGMLSEQLANRLVQLFVDERKNFIIAGPTGSGKTTVATALLKKIPAHERVVSIEDSIELLPGIAHHVPLLSNEAQGITAQLLVKHALRYRPDRLILGETRGTETYDLIRAFNSGHDGSLSTIHASNARQALSALEMLFQMSLPPNASLSADVVQKFISHSVHVVVHVSRRIEQDGTKLKTVRTISEVVLVTGVHNGDYILEAIH